MRPSTAMSAASTVVESASHPSAPDHDEDLMADDVDPCDEDDVRGSVTMTMTPFDQHDARTYLDMTPTPSDPNGTPSSEHEADDAGADVGVDPSDDDAEPRFAVEQADSNEPSGDEQGMFIEEDGGQMVHDPQPNEESSSHAEEDENEEDEEQRLNDSLDNDLSRVLITPSLMHDFEDVERSLICNDQ